MNYKALLGTAIVSGVLGYLMNTYLFTPTLSADAVAAAAAMVPAYAMWAVTSVIGAFVISWVTGMTGNGVKSGLVIAVSQIVLVDVFYVLDGRRALAAELQHRSPARGVAPPDTSGVCPYVCSTHGPVVSLAMEKPQG